MDPGNSASNSTVTPLSEAAEEYSACLDALRKTGCYNETRDGDFISNMTPGKGIGTTTTTLSWETTKPMNGFSLKGLPVNIIYEGVLGYAMVGWSAILGAMNPRIPDMDVVSMF